MIRQFQLKLLSNRVALADGEARGRRSYFIFTGKL